MGWETGLDKTFKEAPEFVVIYTTLVILSVAIILVPKAPLVLLMVLASFFNGLLLPFVLVFALILVNDSRIMGEYVNTKAFNTIAWMTVVSLIFLTCVLIVMTFFTEGVLNG